MKIYYYPGWLLKMPKVCTGAGVALILATLMITSGINAFGQATVTTLTDAGSGKAGYRDGNTFSAAQFRYPSGIALDPSSTTLFVADNSNNAVRVVTYLGDKVNSYTYSAFTNKDGISHPVDIAVDSSTNVYVLNYGTGKDGTILQFNGNYYLNYGIKQLISTNAYKLTNASAIALDTAANLYAVIQSNTVVRFAGGSNILVGVITNKGTSLKGMVVLTNGKLAITDAGNNGIWLMDPANTNLVNNATKFTGFNGAGDVLGPPAFAAFNRPEKIAKSGSGYLVVADYNNNKVKVVDPSGTVTRLFGVSSNYWGTSFPGWHDGTGNPNQLLDPVEVRQPLALAVANSGTVYDMENFYSLLRQATGTGLPPMPPPPPPVPAPQIGWVEFPPPNFTSVFHAGASTNFGSFVFNNDAPPYIVILGTAASQTFFTYTNTPATGTIPDPTSGSSAPVGYQDGLFESQVVNLAILHSAQVLPDLTIKAFSSKNDGSPNSAIITARFQFITGNPVISGGNAAAFTLSDVTKNAHLYYTIDGSDPSQTNGSDLGTVATVTNVWSLTLLIQSNILFKVRAFHDNYQPSAVVSNLFSTAGFQPTTITFGRASGEPYSKFIARPGQFYYAPVTLNLTPGFTTMYSLQFNLSVTNGYTNLNTGAAIPPVVVNTNTTDFFSMLMTSVIPAEGRYFPPASGTWYLSVPPLRSTGGATNANIIGSKFVNSGNNLLGVGWIFRTGFDYLYTDDSGAVILDFKTSTQDLITYSIVHDTLFKKSDGLVVVGAYTFQIPANATNGDQYFIQLGSPSATSDGVGAGIYIAPPNASQAVTIGSPTYVVGDVSPFHWLNAGDFGDGSLDNSDVMQAYQTGIVQVDMPPTNSDFYLAVDSSGGFGAFDGVNNYYTNSGTASIAQQQAMWDGNDLLINTNAFGDGVVDVNDLFVTFRRSLDPSLVWFKRYWTNGQFVAVTTPSLAFNTNIPHVLKKSVVAKIANNANFQQSFITFTAGDAVTSSGQTIQVPIYAQINGSYPLKVLGLNLSVVPLDGSPALTQPITFAPVAGLGSPSLPPVIKGNSTYAAAWLDNSISGLTGNVLVGTLTIPVPANATSSSAYAVHFNLASGSPNGLALFPKQTVTGLVTLSSRTNSTYGDGIPDSWRLRWFGTANNLLSASNACPSGDGVPNWKKFIAGVDPEIANDFPSVNPKSSVPTGYSSAVHWPSVNGKQYVIERSTSLFSGSWSVITTNTGTGGDMEFDDTNTSGVKFYRVRILP